MLDYVCTSNTHDAPHEVRHDGADSPKFSFVTLGNGAGRRFKQCILGRILVFRFFSNLSFIQRPQSLRIAHVFPPFLTVRTLSLTHEQELGPRFTLKMRWLQEGTFDTQFGEYEWIHKRKEMDSTRRTFHL